MSSPIENAEKKLLFKTIFVCMFKESVQIKNKVLKICDSFSGDRFDVSVQSQENKLKEIEVKLTDLSQLRKYTEEEMKNALNGLSIISQDINASKLSIYKLFICKEKTIYNTMNYLLPQGRLLVGAFWMPERYKRELENAINLLKDDKNITPPTIQPMDRKDVMPPTYFKLNSFTATFQSIVSTYGIPGYREVNPGFFTCVSFPFLFGVMFGDACHGMVLLILSLYVVIMEKSLRRDKTILEAAVDIKYLLLMMGFFAVYCGFLYDDFASIPFEFWQKSAWNMRTGRFNFGRSPIFGFDKVWGISDNGLTYMNSFKMKFSVIIGILHMAMGVFMKLLNGIEFNRWYDIVFEFIPQFILLVGFFGYMDLLIIVKWLRPWDTCVDYISAHAPSVINIMINIPLGGAKIAETDTPILGKPNDSGRLLMKHIGLTLLIIAVVCVPIMLVPKPFIIKAIHQANEAKEGKHVEATQEHSLEESNTTKGNEQGELDLLSLIRSKKEVFQMSEVFVHQMIETIEFVLGCISNTASYLRLWALSLAHGQLSEVFFACISIPLKSNGWCWWVIL
jgi:V-type H+-transporting ATPase subunit a